MSFLPNIHLQLYSIKHSSTSLQSFMHPFYDHARTTRRRAWAETRGRLFTSPSISLFHPSSSTRSHSKSFFNPFLKLFRTSFKPSFNPFSNFLQTSFNLPSNLLQTSFKPLSNLPSNLFQPSFKPLSTFLQTSFKPPSNLPSNLSLKSTQNCPYHHESETKERFLLK